MNVAALVLMTAGLCGDLRADDCAHCSRPQWPLYVGWHSFWCNLARPCDCRQRAEFWPLEYPGARGRGWQAHGVAVTKDMPINIGPHAVRVEYDEHGLPRVAPPLEPIEPGATPPAPLEPALQPARHKLSAPAQTRFRFVVE